MPYETEPIDRPDFILGLSDKEGHGIPATIAGRVMEQVAAVYPHTTIADCWPGVSVAMSIKWDDVNAVEDGIDDTERTTLERLREQTAEHTQALCLVLDEPYESDDHGTRYYTWNEALSIVRGRTQAWGAFLERLEEVDPQWLDDYRQGNA